MAGLVHCLLDYARATTGDKFMSLLHHLQKCF